MKRHSEQTLACEEECSKRSRVVHSTADALQTVRHMSKRITKRMKRLSMVMSNLETACSVRLAKLASYRAALAAHRSAASAFQAALKSNAWVKKTRSLHKGVRDLYSRNRIALPTDGHLCTFVNQIQALSGCTERSHIEVAKRLLKDRCKTEALKARFLEGLVVNCHISGRNYLELMRTCGIRFYIRDRTTFRDLLIQGVHDEEEWFNYWQCLDGDTKKRARKLLENGEYDAALEYAKSCSNNYVQPAVIKTMDDMVDFIEKIHENGQQIYTQQDIQQGSQYSQQDIIQQDIQQGSQQDIQQGSQQDSRGNQQDSPNAPYSYSIPQGIPEAYSYQQIGSPVARSSYHYQDSQCDSEASSLYLDRPVDASYPFPRDHLVRDDGGEATERYGTPSTSDDSLDSLLSVANVSEYTGLFNSLEFLDE